MAKHKKIQIKLFRSKPNNLNIGAKSNRINTRNIWVEIK